MCYSSVNQLLEPRPGGEPPLADALTVNPYLGGDSLDPFAAACDRAGALLAIVFADLSMLSKAETERIWLPFTVWLTAAGALLPPRSHRWWLALNVVGALVLNSFILTNW